MSALQQVVSKFLAERDQVITAINNCPSSNMEDYWRWQGNAEARRVLREDLDREGIGLATDAKAIAAIKAEALREAAQAQRQLAADSRTGNGRAEHEDRADWLDDRAAELEPTTEGAHP